MRKNDMNAIEFNAFAQDGMLKIPSEHVDWYNKSLRVILLAEPIENTEKHALSAKEIQAFFASKRLDLRNYQFNREEANAQ